MREILFRGKRVDNGEWVEGGLITGYDYLDESPMDVIVPIDAVFYPHNEVCDFFLVNPETVGQYTGLKDRYGVKIFEGDILEIIDRWNKSQIWLVKYQSAALMLRQKGLVYYAHFSEFPQRFYSYEVIGNIHDNPELLEVQK